MKHCERIRGNYAEQANGRFPVDAETLEYIENNIDIAMLIGNIAIDSDKKGAILYGCDEAGESRNDGWLFVSTEEHPEGEIIYFEGGDKNLRLTITEHHIKVNANGEEYDKAYTYRVLNTNSNNVGEYTWEDFTDYRLPTLKAEIEALEKKVAEISPCPVGTVQIFAGTTIPDGWLLCDGRMCFVADYGALYKAIGNTYDSAQGMNGSFIAPNEHPNIQFRIPDLRGRFIVGHNVADGDYKTLGAAGGKKKVQLTAEESGLPAHSHTFALDTYGKAGGTYATHLARGNDNTLSGTFTTKECAGQAASSVHENRPPYYALSYIIKAK